MNAGIPLCFLRIETLAQVVADLEDAVVEGLASGDFPVLQVAQERLAARIGEENALRVVARVKIDRKEAGQWR